MKLAFIGTHGVGKTTLCYDVAASPEEARRQRGHREGGRAPVAPAREPQDLPRGPDLDPHHPGGRGDPGRRAPPVVVCDRSALDNYAYMALACGRQKPVERFVDCWMKTYDLLFKVPFPGAGASADGFRDTDEFFMRAIDELVDRLLAEKKIPHERLPVGERERWAALAVEAILRAPAFARLF